MKSPLVVPLGIAILTHLTLPSFAQSKKEPEVLDPASITVPEGFEVELVYTVPREEQGSWVALGKDQKGRLIASDQNDAGLFRITLGDSLGDTKVEKMPFDMGKFQGIVPFGKYLYLHRNHNTLYRIWDSDGDDMPDQIEELPGVGAGGGEHGNHAVIVTEDGEALYVNSGNHTPLPEVTGSRVQSWDEDLLLSRQWDARGHARGRTAPGGWVCRYDPDKQTYEVYCIGFRNQYDIALNAFGDMFTYDADMEWDMGMPWYRPTRINHVVSGGDYGWRSGSGKWPAYYEDTLPAVIDIGPGSPTGVLTGEGAKYPGKYQNALFALDWTYGTIYAIHLQPEGAGYTATKEAFAQGAPLPVTDAIIAGDGAMYFTIGGRNTQSALYRIRYAGNESIEATDPTDNAEANKARTLRRKLETFHDKPDPIAIPTAWPHLASKDRFLRHAARVAVESQPVDQWAAKVADEENAQAQITGAVALARMGEEKHQPALIAALLRHDLATLSEGEALGLLRAYALTFIRQGRPTADERKAIIAQLDPHLPAESGDLNTELLRILSYLEAPGVIEKGLTLIESRGKPEIPDWSDIIQLNERYGSTIKTMLDNFPPTREIGYAFILRNIDRGWTVEQRRRHITFLNEAAKYSGGASFPGFLANIRADTLAKATDKERVALQDVTGESYDPVPDFEITPPKGPARAWNLDEALAATERLNGANFESGRNLYFATSCGACHRFAGLGGGVGPDLTTVGTKFDTRYLLESIIDPSAAISDQYGSQIVTLKDGTTHMGMVIQNDNGIEVYPPDPHTDPIQLTQDQVEKIEDSPVSQMPPGLINTLNEKELKDLIAYLTTAGDKNHKFFKK